MLNLFSRSNLLHKSWGIFHIRGRLHLDSQGSYNNHTHYDNNNYRYTSGSHNWLLAGLITHVFTRQQTSLLQNSFIFKGVFLFTPVSAHRLSDWVLLFCYYNRRFSAVYLWTCTVIAHHFLRCSSLHLPSPTALLSAHWPSLSPPTIFFCKAPLQCLLK